MYFHFQFTHIVCKLVQREKRKRSDSILWQKTYTNINVKGQRDNTKTPPQNRLHNDCGRYVYETLTMAAAALVLNDTFAPRFTSIHAFLDFGENYDVILAKLSSSCFELILWRAHILLIRTVNLLYKFSSVLYQTQTELSTSGSCIKCVLCRGSSMR